MVELEPKYCDVICRRFMEFSGKTAKLESDGRTFVDLASERLGAAAHSYYNSLIRRIVSFARALEREQSRSASSRAAA